MRQAMTATGCRWPVPLLACLACGGLLAIAMPSSPARAAPLVSYRALATADGVRQTVTRPDAPLSNQLADSGLPSAQASLDSLGNSGAYGSFLYPGESLLSAPGLLSGVAGRSLPDYPVIASSNDPYKPEDDASTGPVLMKASSTPTTSAATASLSLAGPGVGYLAAQAKVAGDQHAGTLDAVASTEATALDVAGVLSLSSVRSHAEAHLTDTGVTSSSSLQVGDMTVAGVRVVLTDKGLVLPGQTAPIPDTSPITKPLNDAGISVALLQPEKLNGGVRSGGLRLTVQQPTPEGGSATTVAVFGQAVALVSASSDIPSDHAATDSNGSASAAPTGRDAGTSLAQTLSESAQAPDVDLPGPRGPDLAHPPTEAQPALEPFVATVPAAVRTLPFTKMSTLSFYLVLVLAGAVVLAAHTALRRFGVSSPWTS